MAKLVLLVVAAAWAAVLIPPMLRSRVDNRPNSSVTDFRRQLSTLQGTATNGRGGMRTIGRPLAQSPLQRPAAGGRPGHAHHRQASLHADTTTRTAPPRSGQSRSGSAPARSGPTRSVHNNQFRTHGDPGHDVHRQAHVDRHRDGQPPAPPRTGRRSQDRRPPAPHQRAVPARRDDGMHPVPRRHDLVDGVAVRVRPVVPRPVWVRLPPRPTPPTRSNGLEQRLDRSVLTGTAG